MSLLPCNIYNYIKDIKCLVLLNNVGKKAKMNLFLIYNIHVKQLESIYYYFMMMLVLFGMLKKMLNAYYYKCILFLKDQ